MKWPVQVKDLHSPLVSVFLAITVVICILFFPDAMKEKPQDTVPTAKDVTKRKYSTPVLQVSSIAWLSLEITATFSCMSRSCQEVQAHCVGEFHGGTFRGFSPSKYYGCSN